MAAPTQMSPVSLMTAALPAADSRTARIARNVGLAIAGSLLLVAASKISVPFFPVPMTLQTFAVLMLGATLGGRLGMAAVALYVGYGMMGFPVFANTPPLVAGPAYLLGPTGGFILGFFAAAAIAGWAAARGTSTLRLIGGLALADAVLLTLGMLWLGLFAQMASGATGIGLSLAFAKGVEPFLYGEALKTALAAALALGGWGWLRRRG